MLLHPTSLPGQHGALGTEARRFIDFLADTGFSVWQMLPLGPTHADHSPYQCLSVHAGNTELIALDERFAADKAAYAHFLETNRGWLDDYVLYQAIRESQDFASWYDWPDELRDRDDAVLGAFKDRHRDRLEQLRVEQCLFFRQWTALRDYAHSKGVLLFGDVPIYVAHDSADVWVHRELFTVDARGRLLEVAGVPPDYFSATGQRWGNPLYRWDAIKAADYAWWVERFRTQLAMFDMVRLDHFRGFEKYWEIPASAATAVDGRWVEGPGAELFERLQQVFGELPLVAEDLGIITPEVDALRLQFGFPGMKILQFAFDGSPDNPYLPANHVPQSVVYTGTHDNDTTLGWYEQLDDKEKQLIADVLDVSEPAMPWTLIHAALASESRLAIIPMQDLLALDSTHRMNIPGTTDGNWSWQFEWQQLPAGLGQRLRTLVERFSRLSVTN